MRTAAIVLAGGRSRRMGTAKAALHWHGTPLVAHVAAALAALVNGPVVVVGASGQRLPALPPGTEVATDAEPDRGPLAGLTAGLAALQGRAEVALVAATDQPFLADAGLKRLLAAAAEADAAAFSVDGQLEPLGAAYRVEPCLALARERLAGTEADASLRGLLQAAGARTLAADAATARALASLDTPQAYAAALSRA